MKKMTEEELDIMEKELNAEIEKLEKFGWEELQNGLYFHPNLKKTEKMNDALTIIDINLLKEAGWKPVVFNNNNKQYLLFRSPNTNFIYYYLTALAIYEKRWEDNLENSGPFIKINKENIEITPDYIFAFGYDENYKKNVYQLKDQ